MRLLALDIGTRRTGVASYDDGTKIVLPLDTITHTSFDDLLREVESIVRARRIDHVFLGLPLLPSGKEGAQGTLVRQFEALLRNLNIPSSFIDERYTTPRTGESDGNAAAACSILQNAISSRSETGIDKDEK